jgi:threonine dehydrogenase-like Zn-dependent dehydrogenase
VKTESLWYLGNRKIEIRPVEIPEPRRGEVLVALEACGLCNWDIQAYLGNFARHHPYPFAAGHEGVGRVLRLGEGVTALREGQRVVLHELPIGTPGGALLARHALRPVCQATPVPEDGGPVEHWIVEPVVCVLNGLVNSGLQPGDRVAVVGSGYMGLLFVQGLTRCLCGHVAAIDPDTARLELAAELGAHSTARPDAVGRELHGSFDVVFESAARPEALELAMQLVRPGGIIVVFAWHHHEHTFDLERWHVHSWRLLNLGPEMNPHFGDLYPRTVALMANGTFSNRKLITHRGSLGSPGELFQAAAAGASVGYLKGVVTFP